MVPVSWALQGLRNFLIHIHRCFVQHLSSADLCTVRLQLICATFVKELC
ncbi:cytochrome p450 [Moniliophthora roreri]|nr:cytochrome p450 [Moniliophthora roreri]